MRENCGEYTPVKEENPEQDNVEQQLDEAEQKVKILTEQGGKKDEKDFECTEE